MTIRSLKDTPRPTNPCPPEILALLDEALEALPEDAQVLQWCPRSVEEIEYKHPELAQTRVAVPYGTQAKPTWTVKVYRPNPPIRSFLEWWDDRWVWVSEDFGKGRNRIVWEGRILE